MSALMPLLFLSVSAVLVCFGIYKVYEEFRRVHRLQTWTYTTAHILHSRVTESSGYEGATTYNVEVEYQYEVAGSPFRGSASLMAVSNQCRRHAEALCQSHPPDAGLPIVYNPKQVDESDIADPSVFRAESILVLVFGIGLIFFTFYFFAQ